MEIPPLGWELHFVALRGNPGKNIISIVNGEW